jgi:3-oxoacyl-[acyl-carrier protein] reductase
MIDHDEGQLHQAADAVGGVPFCVDVSAGDAVTAAVQQINDIAGTPSVLINNAGILRDGVVWKLSDSDWRSVMDVHLGGTFCMTRACIPLFRRAGYGRVINVTSFSGLRGNVGQANYASAKAGIIGFTKTVAREVGAFGITVNAISPNALTRMVASIPEDKKRVLEQATPLGRFGDPAEMYNAVAFLASREAGYITGVVLPVDGGLSI